LDDTVDSILKYRISTSDNKDNFIDVFEKLTRMSNIEVPYSSNSISLNPFQVSWRRLTLDEYLEKDQASSSPQERLNKITAQESKIPSSIAHLK